MYYLTRDKFINLTYNIQCFSNNDNFTYETVKHFNLEKLNTISGNRILFGINCLN